MQDESNMSKTRVAMASESDSMDLRAVWRTIWRGKWLIGFVTVLFIGLAGYYAFVAATPQYRATSVVILETQQESVVDLQSVVGGISGDTSEINSEVEVLRARSLMGKVVDRLDLVSDPEFNRRLRAPGVIDQVQAQVFDLIGLTEPDTGEPDPRTVRDGVVTGLLRHTTVRNVPNSYVFQITVQTTNARKSALIADTIVDAYILNQLEVKFAATEQATSWLTDRVAELQVVLEEAKAEVSNFSASTNLVSEESLLALERQLKDLRDRVGSAEEDVVTANARLDALVAATDRDAQAAVAGDQQLTRLLPRARTDDTVADAFDARLAQVVARAELEANRATQQAQTLAASVQPLEDDIAQQGEDLITLQQLQREAEANRLLYEYFLGRLKETSAQEGIQQADSRILSDAVVPLEAAAPRKSLFLVVGALMGVIVGVMIVLLREGAKNNFRTAADLEDHTGEAVLGQIPLIPGRARKRTLEYLRDKPTSAAAEAVRNLRTSVLLSNVDKPPQVLLSTSSVPAEGKTTNSLALSQNLSNMGKKVLLIEGDIRRRTFHAYFENLPKRGVVSVLAGDVKLEDALYRSELLGADLLAGETTKTNAADLFSSDRFRSLLRDLRETYDYIIIDTPPVLVVPDARIIAQHVDAVLFTVKWDSTTKPQIDESLRLFRDAKLRVAGLIMSQISPRGMKTYGYGGKYGAYGGYGDKYYTN